MPHDQNPRPFARRSRAVSNAPAAGLLMVALFAATGLASRPSTAGAGTTTGFSFLTLPAGTRAAAMGGAYVAAADDPSALFWNPAGLAAGEEPASGMRGLATADHNESFQKLRQDLVGGVLRRGGDGIGGALNAHYT